MCWDNYAEELNQLDAGVKDKYRRPNVPRIGEYTHYTTVKNEVHSILRYPVEKCVKLCDVVHTEEVPFRTV